MIIKPYYPPGPPQIGKTMSAPSIKKRKRKATHGGMSWSSYWATQSEVLFFGLYSEIVGGEMPNKVTGAVDFLTVAGVAGSETYEAPDTAPYQTADTDNIWFRADVSQRTATTAELIGYDFGRTIVYYGDTAPNAIVAIMILKAGEVLSATQEQNMRTYFHLSIWWDNTLSLYGNVKDNRGVGQSSWKYFVLYDMLTTKPSDAIRDNQDIFVNTLVRGGVWAKLDRIFLFAQTINTADEALLDGIDPTRKAVLISTPTFTALEGFTGDAAAKAIDSAYNPTLHAVNYAQNSATVGYYTRNNNAIDANILGTTSALAANEVLVYNRYTDNKMYVKFNSNAAYISFLNANSSGMTIITRNDAAGIVVYRNKVPNAGNQVSDCISTHTIPILCAFVPPIWSAWTPDQVSLLFFGSGFSQADVDVMTDAFEVYMDSNGKGVI